MDRRPHRPLTGHANPRGVPFHAHRSGIYLDKLRVGRKTPAVEPEAPREKHAPPAETVEVAVR